MDTPLSNAAPAHVAIRLTRTSFVMTTDLDGTADPGSMMPAPPTRSGYDPCLGFGGHFRMRTRLLIGIGLGLALSSAVIAGQAPKAKAAYSVPRMPDGHPDLQGVWANNNMTPLERPAVFGNRQTMTDAEFAAVKKNLSSMMDGGDAFFADELILAAVEGSTKFSSRDTQTGNYGQAWLSEQIGRASCRERV